MLGQKQTPWGCSPCTRSWLINCARENFTHTSIVFCYFINKARYRCTILSLLYDKAGLNHRVIAKAVNTGHECQTIWSRVQRRAMHQRDGISFGRDIQKQTGFPATPPNRESDPLDRETSVTTSKSYAPSEQRTYSPKVTAGIVESLKCKSHTRCSGSSHGRTGFCQQPITWTTIDIKLQIHWNRQLMLEKIFEVLQHRSLLLPKIW